MTHRMRIVVAVSWVSFSASPLLAQQLGYKLLGASGIDAGTQSPPGLYVVDRVLHYSANELRDQNGNVVPIAGLNISATGMAIGTSYTLMTRHHQYFSFAVSAPIAKINVNSDNPAASLTGYGFGDLFVQPFKIGWRPGLFDVVSAYMVYAPTGKFEPRRGSVGSGYWTHQFSLGGARYLDTTRSTRISALASYEYNTKKRGIDVRRGNMFQIQGGAGVGVARIVVVGVAGYALWQATADRGSEIPPALRGQWSRTYALGPEVDVYIPQLRTRAELRFEREFAVRSRPQGYVIAGGLAYSVPLAKAARSP